MIQLQLRSKEKQTVEVKLGENKISKEFDIKYLDGVKDNWGVTVNGRITLLDKENSKIHHLAYINPKKSDMTSITINGFFAKGGIVYRKCSNSESL